MSDDGLTPKQELQVDGKISGLSERIDDDMKEIHKTLQEVKLDINTLSSGVGFLKWMIPASIAIAAIAVPLLDKVL